MALRPERFVPRHQLDELVALLCASGDSSARGAGVAITTALQGAGGFGKTTLAQALCHDERVRRAYPDGILWVTLGERPSDAQLLGHVFDLIRWAGSSPTEYSDVNKAGAELRERLAGRRVLLVVDDAWRMSDLALFRDVGSAVLMTTRDRHILPADCKAIAVDAMARDESTALLSCDLDADDATELAELSSRLGCWPLLLDLVNRQIRELVADSMSFDEAIAEVKRLLEHEGLTAFDLDDDEARRTAVARTMAVSLRSLDDQDRQRYRMLAVFPEDVDIPLGVLARYWKVAEGKARKLCQRLHGRSMLQRFDRAAHTIRLHDVVRRYLIDEHGDGMQALHRRWLEAFRPRSGQWSELPREEHHAWHHLAYHLRGAGEIERLRGLLMDYHWLDARLRAACGTDVVMNREARDRGGPAELISDFAYADDDEDVSLVRDALRLSSHVLARDVGQLASQLVGRLLSFEDRAAIRRLLTQTRAESRHAWLCPLAPSLTPPGGPLVRTLVGHAVEVGSVAVTPDGKRVISASVDRTLKIWDFASGRELSTLHGHSWSVTAVAIMPDGKRIISASLDRTLRVWDLATGRTLGTLHGHSGWVLSVATTPDGAHAISASDDHTLKVWDLASGNELRTLHGHSGWVEAVAVTPDGAHAISASRDHTLKVWDLGSGHELRTLHGHSDWVAAVAVTPDGAHAISASSDKTLKVWDLASGCELRTLRGHSAWVRAVAVMPDGAHAISASLDKTLRVWELASGREIRTLRGHSERVCAVAVTPDSAHAVSASADSTLKVWDLGSGHELRPLHEYSSWIRAVAVTPDGAHAVSASADCALRIWDLASGRVLRTLHRDSSWVGAVAVTPDGAHVVSGSRSHTLEVWDLASGREIRILQGHSDCVEAVAVTPDGASAISASADKMLKVWDLTSGGELRTLRGHAGWVKAVAVTPDGDRAVSASGDHTLKVWDLVSGHEIRTLHGHAGSVWAVAVTPDGVRAISASGDHTLKVWDLGSGREVRTLHGHAGSVWAVTVTANGAYAISTSQDNTLRVWNLSSGHVIACFTGEGSMDACTYEPQSNTIVAGDAAGQVHFLRLIEPAALTHQAQPSALPPLLPDPGAFMSHSIDNQNQDSNRLYRLFEKAAELPLEERARFVEQICANEPSLGAELESLLAAHDSPSVELLQRLSNSGQIAAQQEQLPIDQSRDQAGDDHASTSFAEGQRVAHYQLFRELGRGGMGAVFLALDTKLHRRVAIRFVNTKNRQMTARFIDEARATARCHHENIVNIYEVNEIDGYPYMVLEYLEGESLRQRLYPAAAAGASDDPETPMRVSLPVEEALAIIVSIVQALECAHARGIIHRDLKPDNIFLCKSGQVKLLDFGVAKLLPKIDASLQAHGAALLTTLRGPMHVLTHRNALVGTLPYMAPEQWSGGSVLPCTDMWAVGVILYEMLAGAHPLEPLSYDRLEQLVPDLDIPMPRLEKAPLVPDRVTSLVESCLRKRQSERIAGTRPFLEVLAAGRQPGSATREARASALAPARDLDRATSATLTILVLPANPADTSQMAVRREIRAMQKQLGLSERQATVELVSEWPMRAPELSYALLEHQPDVIHFVGRGGEARFMLFDDTNSPNPISPEAMTQLLTSARPKLRLITLCGRFAPACAHALARGIDAVIMTGQQWDDPSATRFASGVYSALAFGRSVQAAADMSMATLALAPSQRGGEPIVVTREDGDARTLKLVREPSRAPASAPPLLTSDSVRLEVFEFDTSRCTAFSCQRITDDMRRQDAEKRDALRPQVAYPNSDQATNAAVRAKLAEWIPYDTGEMYLVGQPEQVIPFLVTVQSHAASMVVLHTIEAAFFHRGTTALYSPAGYQDIVQRSRALTPIADYTLEAGSPRQPMIPNLAIAPGDAISFSVRLLPIIFQEFSMRVAFRGSQGVVLETSPFHVSIADARSDD